MPFIWIKKMNTKQVIVIRKDLNMRKGKMCAQASHASMAFLTKHSKVRETFTGAYQSMETYLMCPIVDIFKIEVDHWLNNSFRKICVFVNSKEELYSLYGEALDKGLISHMIVDNGATEFNGVATATCIAIGPHFDEKFEGLTNHLPLL